MDDVLYVGDEIRGVRRGEGVQGVARSLWPAVAGDRPLASPLVQVSVCPLVYTDGTSATAISFQVHHSIMDGKAFFSWIREFAHIVRTGERSDDWRPVVDRSLVGLPVHTDPAGLSEPPPLFGAGVVAVAPSATPPPSPLDDLPDEQKAAAVASLAPPATMVTSTLSSRDVESWRDHLALPDASNNTIVCAVLWHAMWASVPEPVGLPTSRFAMAVDVRRYTSALASSSDFLGNASIVVGVDADTSETMSRVRELARRIGDVGLSATRAAAVDAVAWLNEAAGAGQTIVTPFMTGPMGMAPDVGISNWTHLGVHDVDFGSPILHVGPDCGSTLPGVAILLPSQDGDGVTVYAGIHNSGIDTFRRSLVPHARHEPPQAAVNSTPRKRAKAATERD